MGIDFKSKTTEIPWPPVELRLKQIDSQKPVVQFTESVTFDHPVKSAEAALKGFRIGFTKADHEFGEEWIGISDVHWSGKKVEYTINFVLRDEKWNSDNPYEGAVDVMVIADLEGSGDDGIAFKSARVDFSTAPPQKRLGNGFANFDGPVLWAEAMLKSFKMAYAEYKDWSFFYQRIGVQNLKFQHDVVNFEVYFELVVQPGTVGSGFPLAFNGSVDVVILAEVQKSGGGHK